MKLLVVNCVSDRSEIALYQGLAAKGFEFLQDTIGVQKYVDAYEKVFVELLK